MEITKASEYKKLSRILFTLPSGAVFELRKLPRSLFFVLSDAIDQMRGAEAEFSKYTPEQRKALSEIYDIILTGCVATPKLVLKDAKDDELLVDDLDFKDQAAVVNEVFRVSGMNEEAEQARKNLPAPT